MTDVKYNLPCKKSEMVWIVWKDAVGGDRVHRDDVASSGIVINTNCGWIAHEDESRVALAYGTSHSGELDVLRIPIECILDRIFVFPKRKKIVKEEKVESKTFV